MLFNYLTIQTYCHIIQIIKHWCDKPFKLLSQRMTIYFRIKWNKITIKPMKGDNLLRTYMLKSNRPSADPFFKKFVDKIGKEGANFKHNFCHD